MSLLQAVGVEVVEVMYVGLVVKVLVVWLVG
jgi:hypothetical protein